MPTANADPASQEEEVPEGKRQNAKGKSAKHGTFRDNCAFGLLRFAFRLSFLAV